MPDILWPEVAGQLDLPILIEVAFRNEAGELVPFESTFLKHRDNGTAFGYSAQGVCKFGFYEFFKKKYTDAAGAENAAKYQDWIYLAGSASAEFIADVALCPFEAVKVRMQTQPLISTNRISPNG